MSNSETGFDAGTARPLQSRVGGSPHHAYKDAKGNVCLLCIGRALNGGVAVNEKGLDWLSDQKECDRYLRLSNYESKFEVTVKLEDLPDKATRNDGRGRALFEGPDSPSDYLKRILEFTTTYQREALMTQRFGGRLMELGIHGAAKVKFEVEAHATAVTGGMMAVDKERFGKLEADKLGNLMREGDLERIYMHLFSLANLDHLGNRLRRLIGTNAS